MTMLSQYWGMPELFAEFLIDPNEYEKLLDDDLKVFTRDLKSLSSEYLPRVSKTRTKHHDLVFSEGLSRKGCKREIASLKEDIQTTKALKDQYPRLRDKGLVKFPVPCDSLVGKAIKELFEAYLNFLDAAASPTEGTLQPLVDAHSAFKEAKIKLIKEYTRVITNMK